MEESRLDRLERLFQAALMHAPEERSGFLDAACPDDPVLRDEVLSLVQADARAEEKAFLETPITDVSGLDRYLEKPEHDISGQMIGKEIGPYRILRFLGHGGMGDVFLAAREEPFRHDVALKIIRRGMDTREVTRRFEMERQILASLSHTNIARLHDGGVTDDGLPWFAMEYVDGTPVTSWCDNRQMSLEDRLVLFRDICRAVHHAHQNLIIHRDLKPSNILVTGDGVPKLLDFGIAKLLNPDPGSVDTPETRTELRAMTPEYASPEQVRGDSLTTATDIYSLGIILYELLSGHRPYRFQRRTPEEIYSVVSEEEPVRPSIVSGRPGELGVREGADRQTSPAEVAAKRGLSSERLTRRLRGDLDNIVLMALRKEPERRYSSAEQLANDISKYLAGEPVIAHRDSRGYRIRKYIRRHRIQTISAAIILLLIIVAGLVTAYQASQVAQQRDVARIQAARAESVTEFLASLFRAADPAAAAGDTLTVRELLQNGAERVESELTDQPEVQATLYNVIGRAYLNLGQYDQAESLFTRGLALHREIGAGDRDLAEAVYNLGYAKEMRGRYSEAETLYSEALALQGNNGNPVDPSYLVSLFHLGSVIHISGRSEEANRRFDEWQKIYDQLEERHSPELIDVTFGMATVCFARREYDRAEQYIREVLDADIATYGERYPRVASALNLLASVQVSAGRNEESEKTVRRSLALLADLYPDGHPDRAYAHGILAEILEQMERYGEAEQEYLRFVRMQEGAQGPDHHNTALSRAELGRFYMNRQQYARAEQHYREAVSGYATALGEDNLMTIILRKALADVLIAAGKTTEARQFLEHDLETLVREHGPDNRTAKSIREVLEKLD